MTVCEQSRKHLGMRERSTWGVALGGAVLMLACQGHQPVELSQDDPEGLATRVENTAEALQTPGRGCDPDAPRSLDGSCNNLSRPTLGAAETPFIYLAGQQYNRGPNEALYFMREEAISEGEPNSFPYTPSTSAPPGTCGPDGYAPACKFTVVSVKVRGFGSRIKYNERVFSNAVHDIATPYAAPAELADPSGGTHISARLSAFVAHDIQKLQSSVNLRRTRQGFPNQSDPLNPTVLSGVPVLEASDLFNLSPPFTPRGVPEAPTHRTMIVSNPTPTFNRAVGGPALEFANSATPFLDLDTLYGHSAERLRKLRTGKGGRFLFKALRSPAVGPIPQLGVPGMPPSLAETGLRDESAVDGTEADIPSFLDDRNFSTIGVASVALSWLHFHNEMAAQCAARHPQLNPRTSAGDDALFECARTWTIAVYQHVVFDEFIPDLTGRSLPRYRGYRPWVDPQLSLETVLGPLSLHSTPKENIPIARADGSVDTRMQIQLPPGQPSPPAGNFPFIASTFPVDAASPAFYFAMAGIPTPNGSPDDPNTTWTLAEDPLAQILRGLSFFSQAPNDLTVIDSQRNIPANYGLDLVANNILRSGLMGAANYYELRELMLAGKDRFIYGQPGCPRWLEFADDVDDPVACFQVVLGNATLASQVRERLLIPQLGVRAKLKHIPLFTGMLMEVKFPGSIFGPTGRALIEEQFTRTRDGDRFYYRNQFSAADEAEVDSYSMAKVLRTVVGPTLGVQDDVFHVPPPTFFH